MTLKQDEFCDMNFSAHGPYYARRICSKESPDLDLSNRVLWARFTSTIDAIPDHFKSAVDVYCPNSVPAWTAICDASDKELAEGREFRYIVMAH